MRPGQSENCDASTVYQAPTTNTLMSMQSLVRVQSQVRNRRLRMSEDNQIQMGLNLEKQVKELKKVENLQKNGNDGSQQLLSSSGDGHVYRWDLRTRTCTDKGVDEGSINGTTLCASPVGNLFAAGLASEIVNVYNNEEFVGGNGLDGEVSYGVPIGDGLDGEVFFSLNLKVVSRI